VPSGISYDEDRRARFRRHRRTFEELPDLVVDETLLYGRGSLQVLAALEAMLVDLLRVALGARRASVRRRMADVRDEKQAFLTRTAPFLRSVATVTKPIQPGGVAVPADGQEGEEGQWKE